MKNYLIPSKLENLSAQLRNFVKGNQQWFFKTPERALKQAYQAALKIKCIEDEHFGSHKVSAQFSNYSQNVLECFQTDVEKYLNIIKLRIAEFKISRFLVRESNYAFLDQLSLIDQVLTTYNNVDIDSSVLKPVDSLEKPVPIKVVNQRESKKVLSPISLTDVESVTKKTGVFPRSIGRTIRKIQTEIAPNSEAGLLQNFRTSRRMTRQSIKFLLLLIIIPLLTQEVSKQFLILPLVERFRSTEETSIFINREMKEQALREFQAFEEELKFDKLLKHAPKISLEATETKITERANEIAEKFKHQSNSAISNVFADFLGLIALAGVVVTNQKSLVAVKTSLNEIVYGLSDSAKAFILILFTDIFVGFHSPHGWEVILEGLASHLGLPADRNAIFIFIATFPVILDTIFKYWIFRYLNQISPSAVATLKNMNE